MTTCHRLPGGRSGRGIAYTKGAPDVILQHCTHILQEGRSIPMTSAQRKRIGEAVERMNSLSLRTLAAAQSEDCRGGEEGMTFLGIVGMRDPARPEAGGSRGDLPPCGGDYGDDHGRSCGYCLCHCQTAGDRGTPQPVYYGQRTGTAG